MDVIDWFDYEILKEATRLGGETAIRDQVVYFFAEILPYVAIAIGIYLFFAGRTAAQKERNREVILIAAGAVLVAIGVRYVIGISFDRPRPFVTHSDLHHLKLVGNDSVAFPSMHAMLLFTFAGVVAFIGQHRRWAFLLMTIAIVVGIARVVAGVHHPTDIIVGALLGLGLAKLLSWQSQWVDRQLK